MSNSNMCQNLKGRKFDPVNLCFENEEKRTTTEDLNSLLLYVCNFDSNVNYEALKVLLQYPKINVNVQNEDGNTPLHLACLNDEKQGNIKYVKALCVHPDLDVNIKNKYGVTPLHHACYQLDTEFVEILLKNEKINVNALDEYGAHSLYHAFHKENYDVIDILVKHPDTSVTMDEIKEYEETECFHYTWRF